MVSSSEYDSILKEWHPVKNHDLYPKALKENSSKIVWWQCEKGHEWQTSFSKRILRLSRCPYCVNRKILRGYNDFATTHAHLMNSWHPTKNSISPYEVTAAADKKVWWRDEKGHEWESRVLSRARGQGQCPACSKMSIFTPKETILRDKLLREWHSTKNSELSLMDLSRGSKKSVWWLGSCGHEWEAKLSNRIATLTGCPYCAGKIIIAGFNDLASLDHEIAALWHPIKNGEASPSQVTRHSGKIVWWLGTCGHEWKRSPDSMLRKSSNCPYCSKKILLSGFNDLATTHPHIAKQWHPTKNGDMLPSQIIAGTHKKAWWLGGCEHEWETIVKHRCYAHSGCPFCNPPISNPEQAIYEYITSLGINAEQSNRKVLQGKELDIYIPSKNMAIEFNGIYWHSEAQGKDKDYHRNKWQACKDKGIQLIQVWEDEWSRNPDQIKRMLAHKLGVSNERKVFARKTIVEAISKTEVEKFLNENHVQGFASGSFYLGLREKGSNALVAVIVLKKESGTNGKTLNIIRYATSANVVGGFTKLLSFAEKTYKPESFITFADHCVSDGGLYESNGFMVDKELPPDYMYISSNSRKHKFGYRLKRFQNDPELEWEEGLTERELAELNRLVRVWDAGKTRYRKIIQ